MGSRTKHRSVKPCKNPYQQSPQKPGITTRTPLPPRYKPVKQLFTRDWNSVWLYLLGLKRRQRSNFSTHTQELQPCSPAPLFSGGAEGRHRLDTQRRTFIALGGLWCGRKPSVPAVLGTEDPPWALKSTQESSQQITDPEQSFVSRGERVWQNKALCRTGGRKHFIATEDEGQLRLAKVIW